MQVLKAGESTTFDVIFLPRVSEVVQTTLYVQTSLGTYDYKVCVAVLLIRGGKGGFMKRELWEIRGNCENQGNSNNAFYIKQVLTIECLDGFSPILLDVMNSLWSGM